MLHFCVAEPLCKRLLVEFDEDSLAVYLYSRKPALIPAFCQIDDIRLFIRIWIRRINPRKAKEYPHLTESCYADDSLEVAFEILRQRIFLGLEVLLVGLIGRIIVMRHGLIFHPLDFFEFLDVFHAPLIGFIKFFTCIRGKEFLICFVDTLLPSNDILEQFNITQMLIDQVVQRIDPRWNRYGTPCHGKVHIRCAAL